MNTASDNLTHFLSNDAGHGMDRLKESPDAAGKLGDFNSIPRAEQYDHRFTDHATKSEHDGGDDPGQCCRHDNAHSCLHGGGSDCQ